MLTWKRVQQCMLWLVLIIAACWLASPALGPVHVEGFSAAIVSLGLHHAQGTVPDFLPYAPLTADYFGLTKFGAMLFVSLVSPMLGGDGAMRLLMGLSLVLATVSLACLVKAWSGARWWIVVATLIILPGALESAFYFNDNLPAAALMFAGFVLLVQWRSLWSAVLAGVLIGCAIAVRLDTVLTVVLAVPLATLNGAYWRSALVTTVVAGIVALAVLFALFASAGVTPFDAIRAGAAQVAVWNRPIDLMRQLTELVYFLGVPGVALVLLAAMRLGREKLWYWLALLLGVPVLINLIQLGTLWQARQFVTLAPFLGALVARGIADLVSDFRSRQRILPVVFLAFALLILLGPVRGLKLSDGPHVYFGRIWGIILWQDWQKQITSDFHQIDALIEKASNKEQAPLIVFSNYWDEGRYLHLRLIERGFTRAPVPGACGIAAAGFSRGDAKIIEFAPNFPSLRARQLAEMVRPCMRALPSAQLVFLANSDISVSLIGRASGHVPIRPELAAAGMGWLSALSMDAATIDRLEQAYRKRTSGMSGPPTLEAASEMNRSVTPFSR